VASAPPTSIDSPLSCRHGGSVPEASSQLIIWPLIAAFSWHEYMRRARHASTSELPEILVARVKMTDSAGFGPERASGVSDVLARRVRRRRRHGASTLRPRASP
jgi:hypothetical protein